MSPRPDHFDRRNALAVYVGRIREFTRIAWMVYIAWVGMMLGVEAWTVPIGAAIFTISIAIDTIGHRTIYKEALKGGEQLVHHITILCGVGSCVLLVLAYNYKGVAVPAMVLTILSFVYSLVDEAFHWRRYTSDKADPVEMWSHVGIFIGHGTMMLGWWLCYYAGYPGVAQTLEAIK